MFVLDRRRSIIDGSFQLVSRDQEPVVWLGDDGAFSQYPGDRVFRGFSR